MLVPIVVAAIDRSSNVLKGIGNSFAGLKSEANAAGRSASSYGQSVATSSQKASGALQSVQRSLSSQVHSQKTLALQERARVSASNVAIAEMVVAERRRQHELKQTEAALIQLRRVENQLEAARSRSNATRRNLAEHLRQHEFLNNQLKVQANQVGNVLPNGWSRLGRQTQGSIDNIASSLNPANLAVVGLSSAFGVTLVAGIAAASAALNQFQSQMAKSIKNEADEILLTTSIVNAAKVKRDEARSLVGIFNRQLSKESGGLVDTTISGKLGQQFLDDVIKSGQKTVLGRAKSAERAASIANSLAGLQQAKGGDPGQAQNVLSDIFARNQSIDQLRGRDYLTDIGLDKTFIPKLEALKVKKLSEVPVAKLTQLLEESLNETYGASKAELKGSISGLMSGIQYKMFDRFEGALSVERDLLPNLAGSQSLFSEVSRSIKLLIGDNGTITQISKLLGASEDPMLNAYNALQGFNNWLSSVNKLLEQFTASKQNVERVQQSAQPALKATGTMLDVGTKLTMKDFGGAARSAIEGTRKTFESIPFPQQQSGQNQPQQQQNQNPIQGILRGLFPAFARPSFNGFIPLSARSAAEGFMPMGNAIATEMRNKPVGSGLLVANSSEYIFQDRAQIMDYVARTTVSAQPRTAAIGTTSKVITIAPNITINTDARMDVTALSQQVVAEIDKLFQSEQSGTLT